MDKIVCLFCQMDLCKQKRINIFMAFLLFKWLILKYWTFVFIFHVEEKNNIFVDGKVNLSNRREGIIEQMETVRLRSRWNYMTVSRVCWRENMPQIPYFNRVQQSAWIEWSLLVLRFYHFNFFFNLAVS